MHKKDVKDDWETPRKIFSYYGEPHYLNLDVCASNDNAKCANYYSINENGLEQEWNGRVWMNPPYSNVRAWVAKAFRSRNYCDIIVCLLPAKTDTQWFHSFVYRKAALTFIKGRVVFEYKGEKFDRPTFPSMIAVYRPDKNLIFNDPNQLTLELP